MRATDKVVMYLRMVGNSIKLLYFYNVKIKQVSIDMIFTRLGTLCLDKYKETINYSD